MSGSTRAAIVIVGNEILSAKVQDENVLFLARDLRELGVELRRVLVVADAIDEVAWAVREARAVARTVITTGGVGPTHDDVTVAGVAAALGRPVVRDERLSALIEGYLRARGEPPAEIEAALKMAELPEGAELVQGSGTSFPVACVDGVYMFPGVPAILRRKWTSIRERFRQEPYHLSEVFLVPDEHRIAHLLLQVQQRFPSVALGSYPDFEAVGWRVKVTLESKDAALLAQALACLLTSVDAAMVHRVEPPRQR